MTINPILDMKKCDGKHTMMERVIKDMIIIIMVLTYSCLFTSEIQDINLLLQQVRGKVLKVHIR